MPAAAAGVVKRLPKEMCVSLTHDRGSEMAQHELFTKETKVQVYFADPQSPWQRGTNENTNGLIRDFFPKGTDFRKVSTRELKKVQNLLNERPRRLSFVFSSSLTRTIFPCFQIQASGL